MTDLVITHLTHPLGPPETLETLGDHWRPLATISDMLENDQFPPAQFKKMCIVGHPIDYGSIYGYGTA